jgi:hypothetical protein
VLVVVVRVVGTVVLGFDEPAASFVGLAWERRSPLVVVLLARTQMRIRTGCPPAKSVAFRYWIVSIDLQKIKSGSTHLSDMMMVVF